MKRPKSITRIPANGREPILIHRDFRSTNDLQHCDAVCTPIKISGHGFGEASASRQRGIIGFAFCWHDRQDGRFLMRYLTRPAYRMYKLPDGR